MLAAIKKLIPKPLFEMLQPVYHFAMAIIGAWIYRFPSRYLFVVGVTGTKGKSTVVELINAILEEKGYVTALAGTIRFKIGSSDERNTFKMTMPGRFFMQRFLRRAVRAGATHAVIEMTSEGVKQFRHKFIALDALVFTNIAPEHIDAHGSFENYVKAKLKLAEALEHSLKPNKTIVANIDDEYGKQFLEILVPNKFPFSLTDVVFQKSMRGVRIEIGKTTIHSRLIGVFNIYNILAAITFAKSQGIDIQTVKQAIERVKKIPGRVESIDLGQSFRVLIDYAHTPQSLEQVYQAFPRSKKICVLGNTGGGRDVWKRSIMGGIADTHCEKIILTNEDPYDENPHAIVDAMVEGIKEHEAEIIMDRRLAIRKAYSYAQPNDVVLITGKGTDPFIMGPGGSKTLWSDATVATEELERLLGTTRANTKK